jgi:hypothetical protein
VLRVENPAERNEVQEYINAMYMGAPEAALHFTPNVRIYSCQPAIHRLPCHLPDMQRISYANKQDAQAKVNAGPPDTELIAWFKFNRGEYGDPDRQKAQTDRKVAALLTYHDFPQQFVYDAKCKVTVVNFTPARFFRTRCSYPEPARSTLNATLACLLSGLV